MRGMSDALMAMRDAARDAEPLTIYYAFKQSEAGEDGPTSAASPSGRTSFSAKLVRVLAEKPTCAFGADRLRSAVDRQVALREKSALNDTERGGVVIRSCSIRANDMIFVKLGDRD